MRTRPILSPGMLYTLMQAGFKAKRPQACTTCKVPLPYAAPRPDDVSANLRIGTAVECPHKCAAVIAEIALDLAARYDMADFVADDS